MVAQSDTNVLIRGASGTGKGVAPACDPTARAPAVTCRLWVVNCGRARRRRHGERTVRPREGGFHRGSVPEEGKVRNGRRRDRCSSMKSADISLRTQVDLLRVLEDKKIYTVGGNTLIPVDFRLVTATNRNLEVMISEGRFREDLYYRLNVFSISIPPSGAD